MDPIESALRHGGVVSLGELRRDQVRDHDRLLALRQGHLHRVRNGWFAVPDAAQDTVSAVRVGGRLSCVSALAHQGLWLMPDERLHVSVPSNAARLRSPGSRSIPLDPQDSSVVVHWNQFGWAPPRNASTDSMRASLGQLILCQPRLHALVAIDSALNSKLISRAALREILSKLPGTYSKLDALADGRAQSGLETLTRVRLGSRRIRVRIQVQIPGVGTVDSLVGDRLIIELDSRRHHLGQNYEKDRTRDLHAIERGYIVLRVSYHRVMHDWESIERVILKLVRRGDHEWSGMHRRLGLDAQHLVGSVPEIQAHRLDSAIYDPSKL